MSEKQLTKSNFGATGWYYIIFTAVLFYLNTGITVDGLNVTVAKFEEIRGMSQTQLLNFATLGGYACIILTPLLSQMLAKIGVRLTMTITLIISGIATIWWGFSTTPVQYLVACAIVCSCCNAYSHLSSTNLANNWYPRKKGLFLGWSTMGLQVSTVAFVAMMTVLMGTLGLSGAYVMLGVVQFIMAFLAFFTVKNAPTEVGQFPDNISMTEEELKKYMEEENGAVSKWSVKDILTCRDVWLIGLSFGILYMASTGVLSQWVPRLITLGYEQNTAIAMLSIAAAIGIFGSYAWGWLDVKIGTKKASVGIMLNYVLVLILTVLPYHPVLLYLSTFLIGMGIGGVANLVGSLVGTIWGPKEFPRVFGIINTIEAVVRVSAFAVISFGLTHLGGYTGAYMIFLILCVLGAIMMFFVTNGSYEDSPESKKN